MVQVDYMLRYRLMHGSGYWYRFFGTGWLVHVGAWLTQFFMVHVDYRSRYRFMHG
jgi:hypothetical protein